MIIRAARTYSTGRPDPNGILAFLVSQLQAAEDAGLRAWIIGHMPPGVEDTFDDQVSFPDHRKHK